MNIKEHFNRMLVTLGWSATGGIILYGMYQLCDAMCLMGG
jgi:hypothetical protein